MMVKDSARSIARVDASCIARFELERFEFEAESLQSLGEKFCSVDIFTLRVSTIQGQPRTTSCSNGGPLQNSLDVKLALGNQC
jgi:hypothetical protein